MAYWAKDIYNWGIFSAEVYPHSSNCNSKNGSEVVNFLSTQWSTDGSTSSEPMGLCITSIVKTVIDNHTLDDRNHQGHHTTLLVSDSVVHSPSKSVRRRSQELGIKLLDKFWTVLGRQRVVVRVLQWFLQDGATPHSSTNHWHGCSSVSLTDWPAAGVTRSGHCIHQTWTPQIFICGDTLRTGCMTTTPKQIGRASCRERV